MGLILQVSLTQKPSGFLVALFMLMPWHPDPMFSQFCLWYSASETLCPCCCLSTFVNALPFHCLQCLLLSFPHWEIPAPGLQPSFSPILLQLWGESQRGIESVDLSSPPGLSAWAKQSGLDPLIISQPLTPGWLARLGFVTLSLGCQSVEVCVCVCVCVYCCLLPDSLNLPLTLTPAPEGRESIF